MGDLARFRELMATIDRAGVFGEGAASAIGESLALCCPELASDPDRRNALTARESIEVIRAAIKLNTEALARVEGEPEAPGSIALATLMRHPLADKMRRHALVKRAIPDIEVLEPARA